MIVRSIRLLNFRAHADSQVEFAEHINLIHGPNGAGKTNILEALHFVCLSKSFITANDTYAVRRGAANFEITAEFTSDRGTGSRVRIVYVPGDGKRLFVNGVPLQRLSDVVGKVPVIAFSPEDAALTSGGPEERRRLLNNVMSQARPAYLDDLLKYGRVLRQRNALLGQIPRGLLPASQEPVLLSWTAELAALAARIIHARYVFVGDFARYIQTAYEMLGETVERPTATYQTFAPLSDPDPESILVSFRAHLDRVERRERETGRTAAGPHRDELVFQLNDLDVRRYASHGQHRTFGMALKLAQYHYLRDRMDERPILLLDDLFGNLDALRSAIVVELLQRDEIGQSLVTATHLRPFEPVLACTRRKNAAIHVLADGEAGGPKLSRVGTMES